MKTIKQIADEIGVSKTAVRKKIANLGLQSSLQKNGNQFAISKDVEMLIKSTFYEKKSETKSQTANRKPVSDKTESSQLVCDLVSVLKEQLRIKDEQLAEKDKQLAALTAALASAQQTAQAAQALHAGTIQLSIDSDLEKDSQDNKDILAKDFKKRKWWKFWR